MDETMGPNESDASAKLLDLLSPTTSEYALDWRERCRRNAAREARPLRESAAIVYTLIETAKLNAIDPNAWLADTLARIPDHKNNRIDDLLP